MQHTSQITIVGAKAKAILQKGAGHGVIVCSLLAGIAVVV